MFKRSLCFTLLCHFAMISFNVLAITPTFNFVQEINFGNLILSTGSCRMIPSSGTLISFQGTFLCDLPGDAQVGKYTIIANPNKQVQVKILPNLDNGDGYMFNARVNMVSDVSQKVIVDNTEFVEINSGSSGIINITVGGDLVVYALLPAGQTFNFVYDPAIEWNEL
jgi:hypothetical protein